MSPMKSEHDEVVWREREWQNRVGGQLQLDLTTRPGTRLMLNQQFRRIAEALDPGKGSLVLDIGCGTGMLMKWLEENRQVNAVGVDLAVNSLLIGKKEGLKKMLCGNSEALPLRDSCFSYLVCKGSVHHFPKPDLAFNEMYRILKPGGRIVFFEPMSSLLANFFRKIIPGTGKYESPVDLSHKEEFTSQRLQHFLQEAGFVDIQISFHDALAYPLTGAYAGGLFSGSEVIINTLLKCEKWLEQISLLDGLRKFLSWRMLVKASKPSIS